tara:strand:+ start:39 stop:239 length:201 start_codon:yes stop_codon:yes gene_type:complete
MTSIINYAAAFWSVVVMNCIQPVNWEACMPVHEWLLPEIMIGIEFFLDKDMNFLYNDERELLNRLK